MIMPAFLTLRLRKGLNGWQLHPHSHTVMRTLSQDPWVRGSAPFVAGSKQAPQSHGFMLW